MSFIDKEIRIDETELRESTRCKRKTMGSLQLERLIEELVKAKVEETHASVDGIKILSHPAGIYLIERDARRFQVRIFLKD